MGGGGGSGAVAPRFQLRETACTYDSVRALIADVRRAESSRLASLLRRHVFVGVVDDRRSLLQHATRLYLVDHAALAEELFYQLTVRQFAQYDRLELTSPIPLAEFIRMALEDPASQWTEEDGDRGALAAECVEILARNAASRIFS